MRLQMGVCETLLPEANQNDSSYVDEFSGPTLVYALVHYTIVLHGGWLRGGPQKTTKPSKLGGGHLPGTMPVYARVKVNPKTIDDALLN